MANQVAPGAQSDGGKPRSLRSLEAKRSDWARLTQLLDTIDRKGLNSLTRVELRELGKLHRRVASHLAQAKSGRRDPALVNYLNELALRSHNTVYRIPGRPALKSIMEFLITGFPAACQRNKWFILASIGITILFGLGAGLATYNDPRLATAFIPEAIFESIIHPEDLIEGNPHEGMSASFRGLFSSELMWHNMQVSVTCFAGGILFGTFTLYALITNAFMLGGLAGMCHQAGVGTEFWAYVLPHGVLELPAIFIGAGAGLQLGYALIAPGRLLRRDSLMVAGKEAILLALGTLPMLVIAGLIEGFVAPEKLPPSVKLTFASVVGTCLLIYMCRPLRGQQETSSDEKSEATSS